MTRIAPLDFHVFTAPEKAVVGERPRPFGPPLGWDPITSTLIFGERDAVLVDTLTTIAEAEALAAWVALHNRNLTTIYITHGHFDHFYGLSVLLEHFPDAKAIATPKSVELMHEQAIPLRDFFSRCWPGQVPPSLTAAEPFEEDVFTLEGHELRIIEQGQTDTVDTTSLHVPSIDLVVGGDVLYNQCNMYVGGTTADSRINWIAALDRLAALNPKHAVAGHKKASAPDTPEAIEASKQYLIDFSRLVESTASDLELYTEMNELYPEWASPQAWLMFGLNRASQVRE
ncbi:MBL fold metallo-hydrolase [Mycolicibacterium madagascariense]|uniref:MBL fold metallo-hydrolase n=1 Tax=Mycolicibacterium madagascariense TaxID=212765 RepID=A0A7I7XDD9_9MYCO|nr:MBL fold metallo-hydrolase [Mycolicibacterium madagascariense]MCV7014941.1 MBL fold metallo-hydrolase [Mycolicibacterium madagascariense]BBZ26651.1 MBL fold metallo-hydrolase [Mycolicibacterium madagascariense]